MDWRLLVYCSFGVLLALVRIAWDGLVEIAFWREGGYVSVGLVFDMMVYDEDGERMNKV